VKSKNIANGEEPETSNKLLSERSDSLEISDLEDLISDSDHDKE